MTEQKPEYTNYQSQENESYLPEHYKGYTDSFYEKEESTVGIFLIGTVVGAVVGAATALFLAPKTGKEMRQDLSTQAVQLKDKSIEISTVAKDKAAEYSTVAKDKATEYSNVAKDKATEFTAVAKEKTDEVAKKLQEQSGQLVEKVKTKASKTTVPMDDGTVSFEGEEATEYIEKAKEAFDDVVEHVNEKTVEVADEVAEKIEESKK